MDLDGLLVAADLKSFGQWWGEDGVTDARAFDAWAEHIFKL